MILGLNIFFKIGPAFFRIKIDIFKQIDLSFTK